MSKRKPDQRQQNLPLTPAHAGAVDLVFVLRKVAPFLFREKKKVMTAAAPMKVVVKKQETRNKRQTKSVKTKAKKIKKSSKKTKNYKLKTKNSPKASVTVPVARKTVAPKTTTSASNNVEAKPVDQKVQPAVAPADKKPAQEQPSALSEFDEPKGVLLVNDDQKKQDEKAAADKLKAAAMKEELEQEEGWMSNVIKSQKSDSKDIKKHSAWAMFLDRFARGKEDAKPRKQSSAMNEKEMKDDDFLKRVQRKKETSVVGTASDDASAPSPIPGVADRKAAEKEDADSLDGFAGGLQDKSAKQSGKKQETPKGRIISAAELKKETEAANAAAKRLEEATRKEMIAEEKAKKSAKQGEEQPAPAAAAEDVPVVHAKIVKEKKKSIVHQVLTSLGHVGLGRESMQFIENLSTMLNAGLPLIDALQTLQVETRSKPMKKMMKRILDTVENGSPLWKALDAEEFFSLHAIALIRIGEEAGNLAQNMEYLAIQEEKDHELKSKVSMAMIYPAIVMTIMFIIVMGLGLFVLPNLMGVITSLNVPLPLTTRAMLWFSNAFTKYADIVVPGMIGGFILFIFFAKFTRFRVVVQWVQFKIPGIGSLARSSTIARFGVILGGLLRAGVPVVEAVQSLVDVTPIVSYRNFYAKLLDHITVGDSFGKSFAAIKGSDKLLPPSVQQLVITGEKSGALATIMLKIADIYDKKASETAQKLPVILEPMILLIIGALVGTIAFSVIVPIYSIVGSVGH
ncbi:MAG TPA: type II secretion system F family protein [Candidatus Peribacteraceae bacterium]|nr:type II secretion system F family protein [Candidatus Peribacteraceae bacterium]